MSLEKREQEVFRGQEAERIFTSQVFTDAIRAVEQRIMSEWKTSLPGDSQVRETCWLRFKLLAQFLQDLRKTMETGNLAAQQLTAPQGVHGAGSN